MVPASTTAISTVRPESSLLSKVMVFLTETHDYLHINAVVARMLTRDIDTYRAERDFSRSSDYVCSYRYHGESRGRGGPQSSVSGPPRGRGFRGRGRAGQSLRRDAGCL